MFTGAYYSTSPYDIGTFAAPAFIILENSSLDGTYKFYGIFSDNEKFDEWQEKEATGKETS
jgi:hypothetical protein